MKTRQNITYFIENGKFTVDGYDLFDTLEELEADLDWQLLWIEGKAQKVNSEWERVAA